MAGLFIGFRIDSTETPGKEATVNKTMVYPAVKDVTECPGMLLKYCRNTNSSRILT